MVQSFKEAGTPGNALVDTGLESFGNVALDAQAIAVEAVDYVGKVFRTGSDAVGRIVAAQSLETAVEFQSRYLKQSYADFIAEATRLTELYADMAKDACRPFESIAFRPK